MAGPRFLALGAQRPDGRMGIAAGLRHHARDSTRSLAALGIHVIETDGSKYDAAVPPPARPRPIPANCRDVSPGAEGRHVSNG